MLMLGASTRRATGIVAVIAAAVSAGVIAGCGSDAERTSDRRVLPTGEPLFSRTEALWAKGSTVHVGNQGHDIGGFRVLELDWSPYGLFLGVAPRHSNALEPTTTRFYDGTKLHELPGVVEHVEVSPSGRTASWIDYAGSGAELQVVDLDSGTIVASSDAAADSREDPETLAPERRPGVEAVSDETVLWGAAEDVGMHTDVRSGVSEEGSLPDDERPQSDPDTTSDERYTVSVTEKGLRVTDNENGSDVTPQGGSRLTFKGWLGDEKYLGILGNVDRWSAGRERPYRVRIVTCDVEVGKCELIHNARWRTLRRPLVFEIE